ncbi:hypothetical protein MLD38_024720 [Melastoma candidum]|uniref:Uncharacterized protein n=1 Tax=Melastoma candidum TaxID=119954 RepID=A0ACB9NT63_9MYRT|nr:hypothetical protein MLD38_024720 [Melastoma candidum]
MAASEQQPLKKRRLYEPSSPPPSPPPGWPNRPDGPAPPATPSPPEEMSQEEVISKRRNRGEIRSVYECYKRVRSFVATEEGRRSPEFELAFLSLISASKGCLSVQRIVADLIPRYASHCPSALKAAVKGMFDIHDSNVERISKGQDDDGIAFLTVKACILGLVDICCAAASSESPNCPSAICGAVFQNVLSFFVSSLGGRSLVEILDHENFAVPDSEATFSDMKMKLLDHEDCPLIRLDKLRRLCILRILFARPKNILEACFNILSTPTAEGSQFFLRQVLSKLDDDEMASSMDNTSDQPMLSTGSVGTSNDGIEFRKLSLSDGNHNGCRGPPRECLLGLVIVRNPTVGNWVLRKYKKLKKMAASKVVSEILSALQQCLDTLPETVKLDCPQATSDEESSSPASTCLPSMRHGLSNQYAGADREFLSGSATFSGDSRDTSQQHQRFHGSAVVNESDPNYNMKAHNGMCLTSRSGLENTNHCNLPGVSSRPLNGLEQKPPNGTVTNYSASRRDNYPRRNTACQVPWYIDGDSASMDIFSASKQLWLGYMGPNVFEAHVRYEVERFGPVESYFFHPRKGFALVEYRSIIDTVKARDNMRRHLPWRVRFMDSGMGTKGIINGVAVGYSPFVYVGNIVNQGARDEIIHETKKVIPKGPYMATDLFYEGAVLLEFEIPEDAAAVIAHLRQHRREMIRCTPPTRQLSSSSYGPSKICEHLL